jgi:GAF domain-containing protein
MHEVEKMVCRMYAAGDEAARLREALEAVVAVVAGCDHGSVTLVERRRREATLSTGEATDGLAERADRLQYELGEGPCVQALREHQVMHSPETGADPRWPRWAPVARGVLGVGSTLSLPLYAESEPFGSLNLYSDHAHAFDSESVTTARALAAVVAIAIAAGRRADHLTRAMANRILIGQAEGILMERCGIDVDQAFAYLNRVSQQRNLKLVRVAEDLVRTRALPDSLPTTRAAPGAGSW